ncbi:MAG: glycerol-3-phosphate 1-O-acyltransferase PlsY [Alphaproteobacteria bacterium]|nr:glycerol-3-phosphate 1-O-acyltransferase PlsY [Alphaproteobacteria bacterium]
MPINFVAILGYFLGSIPFGLIFVKIFLGKDLRQMGSGNIGTTNVLRTGNKLLTFLTLFFDMGKGAIAVIFAEHFAPGAEALVAVSVVFGHNFPAFLNFKGGKGFATTMGLVFYFSPEAFVIAGLLWLTVVLLSKFSSLGALSVLVSLPFLFWGTEIQMAFLLIALLGIGRHYENIGRLLKGTEGQTNLLKMFKK